MRNKMNNYGLGLVALLAILIWGCGSETPQTQQLYADAKKMWDEVNHAFALPGRSQERIDAMSKIINEKYDEQIITKLEQYAKDAPSGKYASEAKDLLQKARESQELRMLGQIRPYMGMVPKRAADMDTFAKPGMPPPGINPDSGK